MRYTIWIVVAAAIFAGPQPASFAAQDQDKTGTAMKREIIPGSELMTPAERERYRQRVRAAQSRDEALKIRGEHAKQMQERARLRGLRLVEPGSPDTAR